MINAIIAISLWCANTTSNAGPCQVKKLECLKSRVGQVNRHKLLIIDKDFLYCLEKK